MQPSSNPEAAGRGSTNQAGPYRLSLVIPACDAQETIGSAIREAEAALAPLVAEYEIIVVDDGSTDQTADVVRAETRANPRVRLVQHPRRLGHGATLRTGCLAAAWDFIAISAGPSRFNASDLESMLPWARSYDLACGYAIDPDESAGRRWLRRGYGRLNALLFGSRVPDMDAAVTIVRREHLPQILPEGDSSFAHAEILARAALAGLAVVQVGTLSPPRPARPSKRSWLDAPRTLAGLMRFWWTRLVFPAENGVPAAGGRWFWAGLTLLALIAGAMLFLDMSYPLLEPDEGRYAEVTREMLSSGDWVVPTLNRQPFYDKPPLFYWLAAASFWLFGTNEWAARLVPTVAAFTTVLATAVLGRRILGARAALLAGLALAIMPGFAQCGRIVIFDSLLTCFVTVALLTAYLAVQGQRARWNWWIVSAIACGLGVLTKGPVALVLLVPPVAAYGMLNRETARLTWRHWAAYVSLVLGLASPWYGVIIARDPGFAYHFFVDQHLVRFLMRAYHVKPFWYYLPVLLIACMPWSFLVVPFTGFLLSRSAEVRALRPRSMGFFLLWAGWCVLFFSVSSSKLPPYILPALPAVALLVGAYLDRALFRTSLAGFFQQARTTAPRWAAMTLATAWLVVSVVAWRMELIGVPQAALQAGLGTACLAGVILCGARLPALVMWLLCGSLAALVTFQMAHDLVPAWALRRSPLKQFGEIEEYVRDGQTPIACVGGEWGSIPFYLGRDDIVVNLKELCPSQNLLAILSAHPRFVLIVRNPEDLDHWRKKMTADMWVGTILHADKITVAFIQIGCDHADE